MRRTYRKGNFEELNKEIIVIGIAFIIFVVIGAYINKLWPASYKDMLGNINNVMEYYGSSVSIKDIVLSNIKSDFKFMIFICILSLMVITFPIILINFMLKGVSIGYTINSCILGFKIKSIKIILITVFKNLIVIPGVIVLVVISINYVKEIVYDLKKGNKDNILFLGKRYLLNSLIVIVITVGLQAILNTVSIGILQFLVR